ncbi:PGC-1 and ERR-induced regulator in muscle protein 1 [Ambystoma mexicanum]|uniref:PGC-1 and ERR-induced regulator in muscle protein 1 n=1 Tax=Ambystoma mexicanum TaxID=8296 RepID=UPI0037E8B8DA
MMDNFEYSIQLNDRDWANFFFEAEECDLDEASLATADDQVLSDQETEENPQEEDGSTRSRQIRVSLCSGELGSRILARTAHTVWGNSDQNDGKLRIPEECDQDVFSGSEDEEGSVGSVSRYLCEREALWPQQPDLPEWESHTPHGPLPNTQKSKIVVQHASSSLVGSCGDKGNVQDRSCNTRQNGVHKEFTDVYQPGVPTTDVEVCGVPGHGPDVAQTPEGSLQTCPSVVRDCPAEWSTGFSPLSRDPVAEMALGHARMLPLPDAQQLVSKPATDLTQASEDVSHETLAHFTLSRATQLGVSNGQADHSDGIRCSHDEQQVVEESLQAQAPVLGSLKVKEAECPAWHGLDGQGDFNGMHTRSLWATSQSDLMDKRELEEAVNEPLPTCKGVRGVGPHSFMRDPMDENRTPVGHSATDDDRVPEKDITSMHKSPLQIAQEDAAGPALMTCSGVHVDATSQNWEEPERLAEGLFSQDTPNTQAPTTGNFAMTFPETYDFFFCEAQPEEQSNGGERQNDNNSDTEMFPGTDSKEPLTVPELYEYFFCEGPENGEVAQQDLPLRVWCSRTRPPVPPASEPCTEECPTAISFPEAYEYFFDDGSTVVTRKPGIFLGTPSSKSTGVAAAWRSFLPRRTKVRVMPAPPRASTEIRNGGPRQFLPLLISPRPTNEDLQEQAEASGRTIALRGTIFMPFVIYAEI